MSGLSDGARELPGQRREGRIERCARCSIRYGSRTDPGDYRSPFRVLLHLAIHHCCPHFTRKLKLEFGQSQRSSFMSIILASGMSIGCGAAANRAAMPASNLKKTNYARIVTATIEAESERRKS